ncbi:hypothetical protein CK516_27000, partial [Nostoc sp. 'Peltigera malacea cyanobiont' DB3992]
MGIGHWALGIGSLEVLRWMNPVLRWMNGVLRWMNPVLRWMNGVPRWMNPVLRWMNEYPKWMNEILTLPHPPSSPLPTPHSYNPTRGIGRGGAGLYAVDKQLSEINCR